MNDQRDNSNLMRTQFYTQPNQQPEERRKVCEGYHKQQQTYFLQQILNQGKNQALNQQYETKMSSFYEQAPQKHQIILGSSSQAFEMVDFQLENYQNCGNLGEQAYQTDSKLQNFSFDEAQRPYDLDLPNNHPHIGNDKEAFSLCDQADKSMQNMGKSSKEQQFQEITKLEGFQFLRKDLLSLQTPNYQEMAPNKMAAKPLLFQSRVYQKPNYQHSISGNNQNYTNQFGRDTTENCDFIIESDRQFETPQKNKDFSFADQSSDDLKLKVELSTQKSKISNLQTIQEKLTYTSVTDKRTKAKILSYTGSQQMKKGKNSGKASKTPILQSQNNSNEKTPPFSQIERNRRVNKAKTKKKYLNKTEPSIQQDDQQASSLSTLRSTLSIQIYQIQCLNSLKEFNQQLKLSKQQLSLQGNASNDDLRNRSLSPQRNEIEEVAQKTSLMKIDPSSSKKDVAEVEKDQVLTQVEATLHLKSPSILPSKQLFLTEEARLSQSGALIDKRVKCNCQKNNCTQGYCDCLKNFLACSPDICQCVGCSNTEDNLELRESIRNKQTKVKNKDGCSCKNSHCQKKYCECFQEGRICTDKCKCQSCKNNNLSAIKKAHYHSKML